MCSIYTIRDCPLDIATIGDAMNLFGEDLVARCVADDYSADEVIANPHQCMCSINFPALIGLWLRGKVWVDEFGEFDECKNDHSES